MMGTHDLGYVKLLSLLIVGLGLIALGTVNALLARLPRLRLQLELATGVATLAALGVCRDERGWYIASLLLSMIGSIRLMPGCWQRLVGAFRAMVDWTQIPRLRAFALLVAGMGCLAAGSWVYEQDVAAEQAEYLAQIEIHMYKPPLKSLDEIPAYTDRGEKIPLWAPETPRDPQQLAICEATVLENTRLKEQVIRREMGSDNVNCHGWVFTEGRYWVHPDQVSAILRDNGYTPTTNPQPGDLAIYRDGDAITHTALVRYVAPGMPVMVEGKWGRLGVFLHAVDQSTYGNHVTYYHTARPNHRLKGVNP